ncbi:MAG: heparinase II/III family protein, partial [Planctomycetota bacterium]
REGAPDALRVGGDVSVVRNERPRMLLTPDSLRALKRRVKKDPETKRLFQAMKKRLDGMLGMDVALDNQGRHYMPSYALLYLLTGEARYAKKASAWLLRMGEETIESPWTCLEYIPTGAFAFDWIHDTLTEAERAQAARGLLRQLARIKKLWRHSDYNNHFVLEYLSQVHVALTLAHERGFEETASRLFEEAEVWLKQHAIPASNEMAGGEAGAEAGGHAEGFSYFNWGYGRPLSRLLAAWKSATGEDLFPASLSLRYAAIWNAYGRQPDGTLFRSEDCPSGERWGQGTRSIFELVAREYGDGIARTLAEPIEARYPQVVWPLLLFRDPSVKPRALETLPPARLFRGLGHVYARSAWKDAEAVFVTFQCGPFYAGHQHLDANAFTVFYRAPLAIDSGVNEYSSHRANYLSRTVAHNTITVLDPDETFPGAVWSSEGEGGSNDGGQRRVAFPTRVTASPAEKAVRDVGRIVHFEADADHVYAVGDATGAYREGKVKRFVRHFLYLRPDVVLVLDDVVAASPAFETRWLLHTLEKPSVEDGLVRVKRGEGALLVWPLRPPPAEREVRVVGGPGHEFEVGGQNYPPVQGKRDDRAGAWRVEVVDARRRKRHVFLHVLWAGPAGRAEAEAKRWTFDVRGEGARLGVVLDRRAGGGAPARHETWALGADGWLHRGR